MALELFTARGFGGVTVNELAEAAGVSHMTVFRHFATKEALVIGDPFDPLIAAGVAAQPVTLPPFERARRGLRQSWAEMTELPPLEREQLGLTLQLIRSHAGLRTQMWESNHATTQAIAAALQEGGASPLEAQAAAGACIGALTAALLTWDADSGAALNDVILQALDTLQGSA
ncbi:TetR family transcriptional regulator [Deinococcus piscis]|uniref:TetR family transcriptional regulator n=1 Tax=Deinococcus piscis TaxID=394230 RepID=A0ABQ3JWM1_9DEIO|nr:TetR family transcriptional regulator [Deinococcus piscis]